MEAGAAGAAVAAGLGAFMAGRSFLGPVPGADRGGSWLLMVAEARPVRSGRGLELVSVACGGPDASSLRWNHHKFKRVFEDALDTAPARRYRIEQMFVEHVFQEVLVSARTLHSPLGPSAVSAASRSHLRLLDGGSASRCSRTEEAVELPAELILTLAISPTSAAPT